MYLLRTLRGDNFAEIGRDFNISGSSSVSSVVDRMRRKVFNPLAGLASPLMACKAALQRTTLSAQSHWQH